MKNDNLQERPLCLSGTGVTKVFGYGARANTAVDHVDFAFHEGELVSIVGESGSGKTTLSKMLLGLMNPTEGEIFFQGKPRDISTHARKKKYWRDIQAIFQDPFSSFNVFHKIDSVLLEGGGTLNWAALESDIVQRVQAYIAPKLFGGADAKSPVAGVGVELPAQAVGLQNTTVTQIGPDFLLESEVVHHVHGNC